MPGTAFAHRPITGLSYFIDGIIHPLFVPPHLLLLIALGLLYGQQGFKKCLSGIKVFTITAAVGLAGSWFLTGVEIETLIIGDTIIVGLLVAARPILDRYWFMGMGAVSGMLLGLDSSQAALTGVDRVLALSGTLVGVFLLLLHSVAFADYFNSRHWQRVGIRIIGSWVSASALLVLALSFSTKH
ncbi:MAG: HupE/UreJ family protein [Candidatus Thiodiazotropha sp.]